MVCNPNLKNFQGTVFHNDLWYPVHPSIPLFLKVKCPLQSIALLCPSPMAWEYPHHCSPTPWEQPPYLVSNISFLPKHRSDHVDSRLKFFFKAAHLLLNKAETVFTIHTQTLVLLRLLLFLPERHMLQPDPATELSPRASLFIPSLMLHHLPGITFSLFLTVDCALRLTTFLKF